MKTLRLFLAGLILPRGYIIRAIPKPPVPISQNPEVQQMWQEDRNALQKRTQEAAARTREPMLLAVEDPDAPQTDF